MQRPPTTSTIDATEIEIWSQRAEPAASSRKKQLELLRAAIKCGVRDKLIEVDVTEVLVVSLRHVERPHWSSEELRAVIAAATNDMDAVIFRVLGFMGLREKELLTLRVGDLVGRQLTVRDSKTRAGIRTLPVPASVLPSLVAHAGTSSKAEPLFQSPRRSGHPVAEGYVNAALTCAVAAPTRPGLIRFSASVLTDSDILSRPSRCQKLAGTCSASHAHLGTHARRSPSIGTDTSHRADSSF